ncbi:MAG: hypothetical protein ACM3U2_00795 [Deltaproteobacteria bacterium]
MNVTKSRFLCVCLLLAAGMAAAAGCSNTAINVANRPAPLRQPPAEVTDEDSSASYEDSLTGGQVFAMYCQQCHNPRPIAERPFANFKNVAAHMRVRANLTGKEYAKLMEFFRRFHDVPDPNPPDEPPPKRFIFNQPIPELQKDAPTPKAMPPVPTAVPEE